ncbi:hypothetical protein [Acidithiobacillus sp.]|uniref:hypothetical protein n=1 Tax=Acidithiobacillus sp. TaxID=1872118 RepID=UPI0026187248|nr:hypothetical protein [Acidithiobacillus sp.]MDD2749611.1 hypothetical protein [Acidithiobacillus sp.]MDD5280522.1 hypothetical protein [Acidithiobacillus sp.]
MSRLKTLLAKMDSMDAMDATPYLISNAGENVRHTHGGEYGIRCNLASIASIPPLASPDCPDGYARLEREAIQAEPPLGGSESDDVPGFDDITPITMQERRAILSRVYGWRYPEEAQS